MNKVAYVGSGLIGAGLALNAAMAGKEVVLQTLPEDIDRSRNLLEGFLEQFVKAGVASEEKSKEILERVIITPSIEQAATGADFIQESGPESLSIKKEILAEIEKYACCDAVIATSTSGLPLKEIFSEASYPERCLGGHPYNPAHILPLVEVTKAEKTEEEFLNKAIDFYKSIGKEPVVLYKESNGYIANRFQWAIHREVVDLVERGVCSVEDADKAMVYSVGLRWGVIGQFLTMHLGVSPEGIGAFNEKYHIDPTLPDEGLEGLASWTTYPEDWCKKAQEGIDVALANRPEEQGRSMEEIEAWRDQMLIAMLRLHKKL